MTLPLLVVAAYLVGSLSPSVMLGRMVMGLDVRRAGSGNAGTTNAFRVLGPGLGTVVLVGDVLKGFLPVVTARHFVSPSGVTLVALAALAGHNWSVFLRGRGGKGVATGAGTILAMTPLILAALVALFVLVLAASGVVSLASLTAAISFPILTLITRQPLAYVLYAVIGGAIVVWAHRANIGRIRRGVEPRLRLFRRRGDGSRGEETDG